MLIKPGYEERLAEHVRKVLAAHGYSVDRLNASRTLKVQHYLTRVMQITGMSDEEIGDYWKMNKFFLSEGMSPRELAELYKIATKRRTA